ncbi:hypothetical protein HQ571_06300 [Candidatus Kuenenbacteria bacterium]|nr:hypothetical protein [Candidatus Kuenenbacteria bacterium]
MTNFVAGATIGAVLFLPLILWHFTQDMKIRKLIVKSLVEKGSMTINQLCDELGGALFGDGKGESNLILLSWSHLVVCASKAGTEIREREYEITDRGKKFYRKKLCVNA